MSWLIDAIRAIEKNDFKIFGRVLDFRLVDYLESASRIALEVRENKLKAVAKFYASAEATRTPLFLRRIISIASVYVWVSLVYTRAIAIAEEAIRIGETVPGGVPAWWFHHLGDLLARAGQRERVFETFRTADMAKRNNFRHKFRLASEYSSDGRPSHIVAIY